MVRPYGGAKGWTWARINKALNIKNKPQRAEFIEKVGRKWKLAGKKSDAYKKLKPPPGMYESWRNYITALNVALSYATAKPGNKKKEMTPDAIIAYAAAHASRPKRYKGYMERLPPSRLIKGFMRSSPDGVQYPVAAFSDAYHPYEYSKRAEKSWNKALARWNAHSKRRYTGKKWEDVMADFK